MTIFAGIYCRNQRCNISHEAQREIETLITRSRKANVQVFDLGGLFVASVDVGAFHQAGIVQNPDEGLTLIVGDPVIKKGRNRWNSNRFEDAQQIHDSFMRDDPTVLKNADGTFAGMHFNKRTRSFSLYIDKLGIRQIFVSITDEFVFFASTLRILEKVSNVPKRINIGHLIEEIELPEPLRRRTPYNDVDRFGCAELMRCSGPDVQISSYWDIPAPFPASNADISVHLGECYEAFESAVSARLNNETEVLAFLSGGLDSRVIVDTLIQSGIKVNSLNYAPPASQDRVFAKEFANAVGSAHLQMDWNAAIVDSASGFGAIRDYIDHYLGTGKIKPQRPACIWSGMGGSTTLGHVPVGDDNIIRALQEGNHRLAAEIYMKAFGTDNSVPRRLLKKSLVDRFQNWPRQALENELGDISRENAGREFCNLIMKNHERRGLHKYYETIDTHGVEQIMPFYDAGLLEAVVRIPIEACLYHRFYVQWLDLFSDAVRTTPWQSYPGHVPCPVQPPKQLGYQFDKTYSRKLGRIRRQIRRGKAMELLKARHFPKSILNRSPVMLATLLCYLGSDRLGYAIEKAYRYYSFTKNATEIQHN